MASPHGRSLIIVSATGALALGLLPNIVQAVPVVGRELWWMAAVALLALLVFSYHWAKLFSRDGVGIVLFLHQPGPRGNRPKEPTIAAMRNHALRRHARCFVLDAEELLKSDGDERESRGDRVSFLYQVVQARFREEVHGMDDGGAGSGPLGPVSLYLTARLPEAYRLGRELHGHGQARLALMHQSEEAGRGLFEAVTLHSGLRRPPTPDEVRLLNEVLAVQVPEDPQRMLDAADIRPFPFSPGARPPARYALILRGRHAPNLIQGALAAARTGRSDGYLFPEGTRPTDNRCAGALVIDTKEGVIPDERRSYEALIRYVAYCWQGHLDRWGRQRELPSVRGALFTNVPVPLVAALGSVIGHDTDLIPYRR
ncbi:hypothetical protein [Streptomyces alkaliphilus]|uniref:hypothetical protein n=1 Tax=Streptomyces alkaliphilus TaxID=1472722 RepID=UPI00117E4C78|nr:hypothetical protein [Streptomyces alkaliphilus]MQS06739.1 hypothetical protein [Streptomyces alkaliphilus]